MGIVKNRLAMVAAIHDVVNCSRVLNTQLASHRLDYQGKNLARKACTAVFRMTNRWEKPPWSEIGSEEHSPTCGYAGPTPFLSFPFRASSLVSSDVGLHLF